nr:carboxypeptidase-like regulatory domain-containing protein [Cyclobacteriaceae bacterium]
MMRFYHVCLLLCALVLTTEAQRLSGKVISAVNREELPGVNVIIKGTAQGSVTDITGTFTVDVTEGSTLVFSFVGFKTQELIYTGQTDVTII